MMCRTTPRREALSSRLRAGGERGSITASLVILPLVILTIFTTIQIALVLHGRNVANAAAQDALYAAQLTGSSEGNGVEAGERTLDLFAGIESYDIAVTKTDSDVTVEITGEVKAPLTGVFNNISVTVTGPTERFLLETERQ